MWSREIGKLYRDSRMTDKTFVGWETDLSAQRLGEDSGGTVEGKIQGTKDR